MTRTLRFSFGASASTASQREKTLALHRRFHQTNLRVRY